MSNNRVQSQQPDSILNEEAQIYITIKLDTSSHEWYTPIENDKSYMKVTDILLEDDVTLGTGGGWVLHALVRSLQK